MKSFDINKIRLKIQSPHITLDDGLNDYILNQIEKLGKIYGNIEGCEMMFRDEKNKNKENCAVEAKIFVPAHVFFATGKSDSFRLSIKIVFDDLHHQIYKFKEKIQ